MKKKFIDDTFATLLHGPDPDDIKKDDEKVEKTDGPINPFTGKVYTDDEKDLLITSTLLGILLGSDDDDD